MALSESKQSRLEMQGFACRASPGIGAAEPWLRATPAMSTALIVAGTAANSELLLWAFTAVSAFAATRPVHPFDHLSNALRAQRGQAPLPANPPPRRFAMVLAALWSAATGALFAAGLDAIGYASGVALSLAGLTVASTHFCLGSWLFQSLRPILTRR